jgi:hypothetical protein
LNDPKAPTDWLKIDGIDALIELALNLHWSWNHAADELWEELDKALWATTQNPWVILRTVSKEKIKAALGTQEFRRRLDRSTPPESGILSCRRMVPAQAPRRRAHFDRLLQHGVYVERSITYLFGWTWQCGGRSDESCQRPGCSGSRSRFALRARIFPPGLRFGRPAAGTLSSQRSRAVTHPAAAPAEWRMVTVASSTSWLEHLAPLLGSVCWKNKAVPARYQRFCQYRGSPGHNQ